MVAEAFHEQMATKGVTVGVHHISEVRPTALPSADFYVFSSPGRFGKPIRAMRRFLQGVTLPAGTKYALLTTEMAAQPNKKTGLMPTEEELAEMAKWQRVRPIMHEILQAKGLVPLAEGCIHVTALKGPLEEGWEDKVRDYAASLSLTPTP
jgi:hypothetical protein